MIKAPKVIPSVRVFRPNSERRSTNGIVIHSMSERFGSKSASEFLQDIGLSVHAFIHTDGKIELAQVQDKKAYHAGKSEWNGETNLNNTFLGVELLVRHSYANNQFESFKNTVMNTDWVGASQFDSLVWLCRKWSKEYDIKLDNIVRHSDVSGDHVRGSGKGKFDVGDGFPWKLFKDYMNGNGLADKL
tara:strand:- start:474 stop:1037 length:564 start_codon:yes stop_codon:yes gene_type:complete